MAVARKVEEGERFNMFTVIEEAEPAMRGQNPPKPSRRFLVQCDCGSPPKIVLLRCLVAGLAKSCGCYAKLKHEEKLRNQEYAKSPKNKKEFCCWKGMQQRVHNKNFAQYNDYGGRGIVIHPRWDKKQGGSFWNFLEDMGHKPSDKHSLERIDVNGDYTPENCKWETGSMQIFNRRNISINTTGICGVSWRKDTLKWNAEIKKEYEKKNLGSFDHIRQAVEARQKAELDLYGRVKMTTEEVDQAIAQLPTNRPDVPEYAYKGSIEECSAAREAAQKKPPSGHKGIYYVGGKKCWRVSLTRNKQKVNVGSFSTLEEAVKAKENYDRK